MYAFLFAGDIKYRAQREEASCKYVALMDGSTLHEIDFQELTEDARTGPWRPFPNVSCQDIDFTSNCKITKSATGDGMFLWSSRSKDNVIALDLSITSRILYKNDLTTSTLQNGDTVPPITPNETAYVCDRLKANDCTQEFQKVCAF